MHESRGIPKLESEMTDQDRELREQANQAWISLKQPSPEYGYRSFVAGYVACGQAAQRREPVAWMHPPTQTVTVSIERPDDRASWRPLVFGDEVAPQPAAPVQPAHEQRRDSILEHYAQPEPVKSCATCKFDSHIGAALPCNTCIRAYEHTDNWEPK